jgi:hypothetical protein
MKFINVKTREIREFSEEGLEYMPYLETITKGILMGHVHVHAWWDTDGNEWHKVPKYSVKGSVVTFDSYSDIKKP